jgi:exopolysaccharide production protein ExoY
MRPGLTGSGDNDTTFETRAEFDRSYVRNWTFAGDIMINLKTIPMVLLSRGCY